MLGRAALSTFGISGGPFYYGVAPERKSIKVSMIAQPYSVTQISGGYSVSMIAENFKVRGGLMAGNRPNDLPCMDLGEERFLEWKWVIGEDVLDDVTWSCSPSGGITFDEDAFEGVTAEVMATAAQTGCYRIIATGVTSLGERIKLKARVKISDPTLESNTDRYA